jgi:hypothetical protein
MKIHFCFVVMFFQLVASLRSEARSSLRSRATVLNTATGGANPTEGQNERDLRAKKVVTTTVVVNVVQPQQACPDGVNMDSSGKCCGVGETTVNGVCCPADVTVISSFNRQCCVPGQIAVANFFGHTFCCPPQAVVASNDGKCCDAAVAEKLYCD